MVITHLQPHHIPEASALFAKNYCRLHQSVPALPDRMEDPGITSAHLEDLLGKSMVFGAFEGGRLLGYLGAWLVDGFRDTERKVAYCPVWSHAAAEGQQQRVYRALYRAASGEWLNVGCHGHAITLLASDTGARETWFWNGFGLMVVDAVRSLEPLGAELSGNSIPAGYTLRKATPDDVTRLADIEAEHWLHYAEPPTLMVTSGANTAEEFVQLLASPENCVWTVWQDQCLAGYLRFEGASLGATEVVSDPGATVAITGAYVRPQHRGLRLAVALLDSALADYRMRGYKRCSVDFESFNPEAAAFWPKHFTPVCLSLMRVPERVK